MKYIIKAQNKYVEGYCYACDTQTVNKCENQSADDACGTYICNKY